MDLIQRQPYSRSGSPSSGPPSPLLEGTGAGYSYPQQFHNPQLDLPQSNQRYAHHQNQHQYSQYAPLFPLRQSRGPTPPPPSFVPLHSDFSLSGNARQGDTRGVPAYPPPGSWGSGGTDRGSRSGRSGGGVTADLFAALLDAREEGRATDRRGQFALPPGLAVTSSTFGIDWPVHNQGGGENMGPASAVSSIGSGGGDGASSGGRSSTGASATDWLDFLSGNSGVAAPPPSAVSARGMGAPWAHSADSMSMDSDGELFSGMGHGMEGQGVKKEVPG
ncbi:hypothetical protein BDZ94DRAFT_236991 [Collybia nuda]|uniref:Uncharacterized protein n=1 Tax=Collybia nuda TaxID=64659 RepID=A0A9P5XXD1_9AGAR|nr:hypothetical protein BDZ94DRAFT_236991 [Collybia nuda]